MALASIQAFYDDDDDNERSMREIDGQMAVINDPSFSVMSKIKLNLTPAIAIQVRPINKATDFV
jgi:hypothetical protein